MSTGCNGGSETESSQSKEVSSDLSSKINPPSSGGENDAFIVYDSRPGVPRTGILDFSWMNDAPAGSHGAVLVRNGGFVFEDGTPVKFFGVNIGFAAAAPDKPVAEAMAAELASCGVNFVRLHALDSTYMGLIDYTKETTQSISKDVLDKLDYFVYCLKQKGIYIHLDTSVIRIYKEGDGFSKEKADIFLVSSLTNDFVSSLSLTPFSDVNEAIAAAVAKKGESASICVIPYGGATLPWLV